MYTWARSLALVLALASGAFALNLPNDFKAVDHNCTNVTLSWTDTNGGVPNVVYDIERSQNSNLSGFVFWGEVHSPATTFVDDRIECDVTYYYRLTVSQTTDWAGVKTTALAYTPTPTPTATPTP